MTKGKIQERSGAAVLLGMHPGPPMRYLRKLGIPFGRIAEFDEQSQVERNA